MATCGNNSFGSRVTRWQIYFEIITQPPLQRAFENRRSIARKLCCEHAMKLILSFTLTIIWVKTFKVPNRASIVYLLYIRTIPGNTEKEIPIKPDLLYSKLIWFQFINFSKFEESFLSDSALPQRTKTKIINVPWKTWVGKRVYHTI